MGQSAISIRVNTSLKESALNAFQALRASAAQNGLTELTLDDINEEIKLVRNERKGG